MAEESPVRYNIGAASRLSGVSREKIRIWERRYGAVTPDRDAGNHRLYWRADSPVAANPPDPLRHPTARWWYPPRARPSSNCCRRTASRPWNGSRTSTPREPG